jgi:hypothetical protein
MTSVLDVVQLIAWPDWPLETIGLTASIALVYWLARKDRARREQQRPSKRRPRAGRQRPGPGP